MYRAVQKTVRIVQHWVKMYAVYVSLGTFFQEEHVSHALQIVTLVQTTKLASLARLITS